MKTPPIEKQIENIIAKAIGIAHKEQERIIIDTIKVTVNGKIDAFRKDQTMVNEENKKVLDGQNEVLKDIKKSIEGVLEVYDGSSKFFKGTKTIAGWITAISIAGGALWAFTKFVILSAIK